MYLRFRGCPVVLDIELSVSAWYQKTRRALLRVRSSAAAASCSRQRRGAVCGVRHNVQNIMQWSGNKRMILCQSEHEKIPPHTKHTHIKNHFLIYGNSPHGPASWIHTKVIRRTSRLCNPQSTHAPPRRDRPGQNTCPCISHAYFYRSSLSRKQWGLAVSMLETTCWGYTRGVEDQTGVLVGL